MNILVCGDDLKAIDRFGGMLISIGKQYNNLMAGKPITQHTELLTALPLSTLNSLAGSCIFKAVVALNKPDELHKVINGMIEWYGAIDPLYTVIIVLHRADYTEYKDSCDWRVDKTTSISRYNWFGVKTSKLGGAEVRIPMLEIITDLERNLSLIDVLDMPVSAEIELCDPRVTYSPEVVNTNRGNWQALLSDLAVAHNYLTQLRNKLSETKTLMESMFSAEILKMEERTKNSNY